MLPAGCKPAPNPLMLAASYGQERLLQWYLEQEGVLIDEIDSDGRCALHHAARHGHEESLDPSCTRWVIGEKKGSIFQNPPASGSTVRS